MRKRLKTILIISLFFLFISLLYVDIKLPKDIKDIKSIRIYNNENELIREYHNTHEIEWVNIEDISSTFTYLLLQIEDKDFYNHNGFEIKRIIKAIYNNLVNKKIKEGASTISQQLTKNLFFSNEKSFLRKIKELIVSIKIERKYSKNDILESYLNNIYYGNGIYGIKKASNFYFNLEPIDLNLEQSIILINLIKSPTNYNPINKEELSKERLDFIADFLYKENVINYSELNDILNTEIKDILNIKINKNSKTYDHYINLILDRLNSLFKNKKYINYSLDVYSNYDSKLQKYVKDMIYSSNSNAKTSIVCIEPYSFKVLAIMGGNDSLIRAIYSKRQIGSTVKPFLYYLALENGVFVDNYFNSKYLEFKYKADIYKIHNYQNIYHNRINMAYALAVSDNVYAVKTHLFLGLNLLYDLLERLEFSNNSLSPLLALGVSESSLLNLTSTYTSLASLGEYNKEYFINEVKNEGKSIYKYKENKIRRFSKKSSFIISDLLTNTFDNNINYATGRNVGHLLDRKYAGKSGLTDYDSYFIGYNKNLCVGVWTGFDDNELLEEREDLVNSKFVWANIMNFYNKNKSKDWYEVPKGLVKEEINIINDYKKDVYVSDNLLYY